MAFNDLKKKLNPDYSVDPTDMDPQSAAAGQGFSALGRGAINAIQDGPAISKAPMEGIEPDYNSPVDFIAGGIGAKLGSALARDSAGILSNEIGSIGRNIKATSEPKMVPKGTFKNKFNVDAYHGTKADIQAFDPNTLGASTNAKSAKKAFFFAEDPSTASDYADLSPSRAELRSRTADSEALWDKASQHYDEITQAHGDKARLPHVYDELASNYTPEQMDSMGFKRVPETDPAYQKYRQAHDAAVANDAGAHFDFAREIPRKEEELATLLRNSPESRSKGIDTWTKSIQNVNDILSGKKVEKYPSPTEYLQEKLQQYQAFLDQAQQAVSPEGVQAYNAQLAQTKKALDDMKVQAKLAKTGQNVLPVKLRMENPYIHDFEGADYRDTPYSEIIDKAKAAGHDSVMFKNTYDPADPENRVLQNIYSVFDPRQVRSKFAAFDPKKSKSGDLSAALGGVSAGAGLFNGLKQKLQGDNGI